MGSDEVRLLIAPGIVYCLWLKNGFDHWKGSYHNVIADKDRLRNGAAGQLLSLRHPKSGNAACYLLVDDDSLREIHWFKQPYTSWFIGDYVAQDGRLYTATPVDPVFILLPIFDEARMKKGDDLGKFRQLDEIMLIDGYPAYEHLLPVAENSMQIVCEVKEVGSSKFFRLDDSKVLSWLYHKVCQLKKTLLTLDKNYAAQDEKHTLCEAALILSEYINHDPWLNKLCSRLRIDISEAIRKASEIEFVPNSADGSGLGSSVSQEKNKSTSKTSRAGKQGSNNKKAKIETESRNIREMFTRASLRRKN